MTTPRDDMNLICSTAADLAFEFIEKDGEFVPFGVVIDRNEELRMITLGEDQLTHDGEKELAGVREFLRSIAESGEFMASAIVSDVRVRLDETLEEMDAVRVEIEHVEDEPVTLVLPYIIGDGRVKQYIDPYLEPGERIVFP